MASMFLTVAYLVAYQLPYALKLEVDDTLESPDGIFLTSPMDAVFDGESLFIADMSAKCVFVVNQNGEVRTIGTAGQGPGEFNHHPHSLSLQDNLLVISEWNNHNTSYFEKSGRFLYAKDRQAFKAAYSLNPVIKLPWEEIEDRNFMLKDQENHCYFSRVDGDDPKAIHLSRFREIHRDDQGTTYLIKKSGYIEIYQPGCTLIASMPIPLEQFKASIKTNKIMNQINRQKHPHANIQTFFHGIPVISAAVRDASRIWLLVKDENLENPPYFQPTAANPWIYQVNPKAKRIDFAFQAQSKITSIKFVNDHLILISQPEASVHVYSIQKEFE